jgi:hypothetical protein
MAFKPGYLGDFRLDNAAGALTQLSPYIDNVTNAQSTETLDVSALGTAFKAYISGQHDGSFQISGPYDKTVHTHLTGLIAAYDAGTASSSVQWGPGGSVATEAKITAEAILSDYSLTTSVSGRAEWSATLQITGAVTNSTF